MIHTISTSANIWTNSQDFCSINSDEKTSTPFDDKLYGEEGFWSGLNIEGPAAPVEAAPAKKFPFFDLPGGIWIETMNMLNDPDFFRLDVALSQMSDKLSGRVAIESATFKHNLKKEFTCKVMKETSWFLSRLSATNNLTKLQLNHRLSDSVQQEKLLLSQLITPRLVSLEIGLLPPFYFEQLLAQNKELKEIKLTDCDTDSGILHSVAKHCRNLESIDATSYFSSQGKRLKNMIVKITENNPRIKSIGLRCHARHDIPWNPQDVDHLIQHTNNLESCDIHLGVHHNLWIKIAQANPNLKLLSLGRCIKVIRDEYLKESVLN